MKSEIAKAVKEQVFGFETLVQELHDQKQNVIFTFHN